MSQKKKIGVIDYEVSGSHYVYLALRGMKGVGDWSIVMRDILVVYLLKKEILVV